MDRIPAFVDDMGETIYTDDIRAVPLRIRLFCKLVGAKTPNRSRRLKNKGELVKERASSHRRENHTGLDRRAARGLARFVEHRDKITELVTKAKARDAKKD